MNIIQTYSSAMIAIGGAASAALGPTNPNVGAITVAAVDTTDVKSVLLVPCPISACKLSERRDDD